MWRLKEQLLQEPALRKADYIRGSQNFLLLIPVLILLGGLSTRRISREGSMPSALGQMYHFRIKREMWGMLAIVKVDMDDLINA